MRLAEIAGSPLVAYSCVTVMPAYNQAASVERVCREWLLQMAAIGGALLVVDDGSDDSTPRLLTKLAGRESDLIVVHQLNAGHGAAIMNGYRQALALEPGWIFQVDSDGRIPAAAFPLLWARRDEAAVVMGRRTGRELDPLQRQLINAHRLLLSLLFGVQVTDPNICFRLMRLAEFGPLLDAVPGGLSAPNVFLTLLAARAGILAGSQQVAVAQHNSGVPSIYTWRTMQVAARCAVELLRLRRKHW